MARDWVKVHASMLFHEQTQALDGDTFKLWVNMLLLAGTLDDGGSIGPPGNAAYALRVSESDLLACIAKMNGRVNVSDGVVTIRDWYEWQPMSNRDRKRKERADAAKADTNGHDASHDVTDGHESTYIRRDETREEHTTAESDDSDRWQVLEDAVRESYGGKRTRHKTTGKRLRPMGRIIGVGGQKSNNDPDKAAALWRQWWAGLDPNYRPRFDGAGDKWATWEHTKAEAWTL